jgi:hypothetical protein
MKEKFKPIKIGMDGENIIILDNPYYDPSPEAVEYSEAVLKMIADRRLPHSAFKLFMIMNDEETKANKQNDLAFINGCSLKTVNRNISILKKCGYITMPDKQTYEMHLIPITV